MYELTRHFHQEYFLLLTPHIHIVVPQWFFHGIPDGTMFPGATFREDILVRFGTFEQDYHSNSDKV